METLVVLEKSTGNLITIKAGRFNPLYHEEVMEGEIVQTSTNQEVLVKDMSFAELKKLATAQGVKWTNTVKKAELIELLK